MRAWKKIFHANGNNTYSDIMDFQIKFITKNKEGYYIMIKGSIQEEDITFLNIYIPNIGLPKYIKQILTDIKVETDNNTVTVGNFNTPITSMDRSSRQKINQETGAFNDTSDRWNKYLQI